MLSDRVKETCLKAVELLEFSLDSVGGSLCDTDHEDALEMLDHVVVALRELHGETNDPMRYEDGSPVVQNVELGPGIIGSYYPRHDGNYEEWAARARRSSMQVAPHA